MNEESREKFGLRTLEDISTLILHSHDLQETLDNIVTLVSKRMRSDVCSVYLLNEDGETLRLDATRGLSRSSIGKITMKTSEGLTGLVLEQRGVVAIEDAHQHPRYKYFRETKEERFHSFLGIPLMQRRTPVGVIVIQTREPRRFTAEEISTLSAIAWQVSSIIINARLLDSVRKKEEERAFYERELARLREEEAEAGQRKRVSLVGGAVSPGFSAGKIYLLDRGRSERVEVAPVRPRAEERERFLLALEKAKIQTIYMEKRVAELLSEEDAAIFHAHLMILEDRGFVAKVMEFIDNDYGAERSVQEAVAHYVAVFGGMEDQYLRERSVDMEDIGRRVIDSLDGNGRSPARLKEKRVLVAEEILPSDLAMLEPEKILGIVTEKGNASSHAAIMAKSLEIPAVLGVPGLLKNVGLRDEVIVDGNSGHVYVNPDADIRREYERLQRDFSHKRKELEGLRELPAMTPDGVSVSLRANIGLLSDIRFAVANGAEGVGLYRTEFPYMTRSAFPNRTEQFLLYRKILEGFPGQPVNIRTLDIGGDKQLPYFPFPREDNPFMGWRSIRISLECREIFRDQLAAVLMASAYGDARLMFPMVSCVEEVREVKRLVAELREELAREGHPVNPDLKLGVVIELPAAAQTAEILIREVDFFSIGTNDLVQYIMAADRNNAKVRDYFDCHHPAVLRCIQRTAAAAADAGKETAVCGEMAGDPVNALLLLGMGIQEFSVSAPSIPVVKQAIRKVPAARAREIAATALSMDSRTDIRRYLEEVRRELQL